MVARTATMGNGTDRNRVAQLLGTHPPGHGQRSHSKLARGRPSQPQRRDTACDALGAAPRPQFDNTTDVAPEPDGPLDESQPDGEHVLWYSNRGHPLLYIRTQGSWCCLPKETETWVQQQKEALAPQGPPGSSHGGPNTVITGQWVLLAR